MKNMKKIHIRSVFLGCLFLIGFAFTTTQQSYGQAQPPFNPAEIVTFDPDNTFSEVIEIINQFALDFEDKFIIDRSGYEGAIGVNLPPMHWKNALQFILDFQDLELVINEEFYEIIVPEAPVTANANPSNPGAPPIATTRTREVRISATFFEGNRGALREVGVEWSTLTSDVPAEIQDFVFGENRDAVPQTSFNNQFVSVNSFGAQGVSQNVFNSLVNFGDVGAGISVQALFSAFEADNLGNIIATPFTKVLDGQVGRIQDGQDFSIKQRDFAGNVSDVFFSSGTILQVTPTIVDFGDTSFVHLDIEAELSSAQPDPVSTIITKQNTTTQVTLLDGEATAIGGLYRTEEAKVRRGIPILKDIPILGYLFGFNSTSYSENELIIIIRVDIEDPISDRFNKALTRRSIGEVIDDTKSLNRNLLNLTVDNIDDILPPREDLASAETNQTNTDTSNQQEATSDSTSTEVENPEEEKADEYAGKEQQPVELTEEQKQAAKELSLPVSNPELMVVVPRAFDLDKYLDNKEKGIEQPELEKEVNNTGNLKYFVIGGSFIVPRNAYRFEDQLRGVGYDDTRLLVNTESRFHFVAYQGYERIDDAINEVRRLREGDNSEAWLFVLDSPGKSVKVSSNIDN